MTRTQLVSEMAKALKDNYDCIMKIDAIKWLKDLYPNTSLTLKINAYHLAYED
jgi:hypothetical protein